MENVADALKIGGSVLLFIIALSVAIMSFAQARETSDALVAMTDRESSYIDGSEEYYYISSNDGQTRLIGAETIIPSIYRAYRENYKIVFNFKDNYYLYENKDNIQVNKFDLEKENFASDSDSRKFLDGIVYGKFDEGIEKFKKKFDITPNYTNLYKYISNKTFKEEIGIYYQEDVSVENEQQGSSISTEDDKETDDITDNVNKTEKKVITYTEE